MKTGVPESLPEVEFRDEVSRDTSAAKNSRSEIFEWSCSPARDARRDSECSVTWRLTEYRSSAIRRQRLAEGGRRIARSAQLRGFGELSVRRGEYFR